MRVTVRSTLGQELTSQTAARCPEVKIPLLKRRDCACASKHLLQFDVVHSAKCCHLVEMLCHPIQHELGVSALGRGGSHDVDAINLNGLSGFRHILLKQKLCQILSKRQDDLLVLATVLNAQIKKLIYSFEWDWQGAVERDRPA
jgi:hypothetical protein